MLRVTKVETTEYYGTATRDEIIDMVELHWGRLKSEPPREMSDERLIEVFQVMLKAGSYPIQQGLERIVKRDDDFEVVKDEWLTQPMP